MSFLSSERGVSEVLGAILVFALVLAVLVIIQVAGVPAANQQIEFEHNARVQADFQDFDQNVDRAAALDAEGSSAVETGVRYPPRLFLINPGPAAGTLSTSTPSAAGFSNVKAVNPETDDFFTGDVGYTTTSLTYGPSYNEYGRAPMTTYEHGVIYNSDENGAAVVAGGNLISGNRISLTVLNGSLSESSTKSVTLSTIPISAPAQTVSVTNSGTGSPLTLTLPTQLTQADWYDSSNNAGILADEMEVNGGNVQSVVVDEAADTVTITLKEDVTYDVRLSKVGIGRNYDEEAAAYLTKPSIIDPEVNLGGTSIAVETRDRFNNPVSGEQVTFTSPDGKFLLPDETKVATFVATSDEKGLASAVFVPSASDKSTANVTATVEFDGTPGTAPYEEVKFESLSVDTTQDVDLTEGDINPNGDGFLVQRGAVLTGGSNDVEVKFQNQAGGERRIVQARINFYSIAGQSGSDVPLTANMTSNITAGVDTLNVTGDYVVVSEDITLQDGQWVTLTFADWTTEGPSGNPTSFKPNDKDFFILTLFLSDDGDLSPEERAVYFVGARD